MNAKTFSVFIRRGRQFSIIILLILFSACSSNRGVAKSESSTHTDREKELRGKYASILGVAAVNINYPLYAFIDNWYGTPYKYAGHSKEGIDCSDFVSLLYEKAYGISISGTCISLLNQCKPVKEANLEEGDLVFFRINSKQPSHVGVYLQNNKFVHASVHSGVVISDLNEAYYKKYFFRGGKIITN